MYLYSLLVLGSHYQHGHNLNIRKGVVHTSDVKQPYNRPSYSGRKKNGKLFGIFRIDCAVKESYYVAYCAIFLHQNQFFQNCTVV